MDFTGASAPLGSGCTLHLATPTAVGFALADGEGFASLPVPLPLQSAMRGFVAHAQFATLQPLGPLGGIALSNGLRIAIGD